MFLAVRPLCRIWEADRDPLSFSPQIAARTFLSEKEYGLAISYCTSAEDWSALGRVVECVLEEYVRQGECESACLTTPDCFADLAHLLLWDSGPAKFAHLVANIAPSLSAFTRNPENSVFLYRLEFAVRFAEFHHRRLNGDLHNAALDVVTMLRDGVAPKSWWAVVLYDTVDLLQNSTYMRVDVHASRSSTLTRDLSFFQVPSCFSAQMRHVCSYTSSRRSTHAPHTAQGQTTSPYSHESPRAVMRRMCCRSCKSCASRLRSITRDAACMALADDRRNDTPL